MPPDEGSICDLYFQVLLLSKRYGFMEYFAVLLMTTGLAYFSLGDYDADPTKTSTFGLILVSTSLVGNAMHSTFQEKFLRSYKPSSLEIVRCLP